MVTLEAGGALEEEVDGRTKVLTTLVLCATTVAKQVILQPNVMLREMMSAVVSCSKETMHRLHDRMKTKMNVCSLCSIC